MGAATLGGREALMVLLTFAGRSPIVDIAIAVFVIAAVSAPALGTMLLVRFLRKAHMAASARGGAMGAAAADDPFAKMTLVVSMAVAFVVSVSLLVRPAFQSGDLGLLRFLFAFAVSAFVVRAGAVHLCCFFRKVHNTSDAAPAARVTERSVMKILLVPLSVLCLFLVPCIALGGLNAPAQRLIRAFALKNSIVHIPTGVATATFVGTTLLVLFSSKTQNAVSATAAPATSTERFPKMMLVMISPLALVFFLAIA
ncbi:hypothetical protein ABZP36_021715 [Zizania latifolia]